MLNVFKQLILLLLFVIMRFSVVTAASLSTNDTIITAQFINNYDTCYSFVLTKHKDNAHITAYIYTSNGSQHSSHDCGVINDIEKAYLVPIDTESNQNVSGVLIFLETTAGLARIINARLNAGIFESAETIRVASKSTMVSMPQLVPRDANSHFLVVAYLHSIEIYSYTPSTGLNFLSLLGGAVSFGSEEVTQVIPVRGFIIVVTNALRAYFISLEEKNVFSTYPLTSDQGIFLRYDPITQKTYLGSSDTEIQDAPMPYGVISVRGND